MPGRSDDGRLCAATFGKLRKTANRATCIAGGGSGKHCCNGPTIVEKSRALDPDCRPMIADARLELIRGALCLGWFRVVWLLIEATPPWLGGGERRSGLAKQLPL